MLIAIVAFTLWAMFLMFVGIVILRLVSKVRVDITLDANDMATLYLGEEIAVNTQTVQTKLRYKEAQHAQDGRHPT